MNLNRLDLNLLLIFLSVYRKRSVTLAGEELELTQSAVSNGLKRLRAHLADPLFVKTAQGMTPTPLAERLAGPIQEAVNLIDHAVSYSEAFDPATSRRKFNICLGDMGQLVLMPRLLGLLEREAPSISIEVLDLTPREAQVMLSEGGVDIAIGAFSNFEGSFHSQRLFSKNYVVMGRLGHPALAGGLTEEKFFASRHAVFRPPGGGQDDFEKWLDALFKTHGAPRKVVAELAHGLGVVEAIAANELLICVPQRMAEMSASQALLQFVPLPFEYPRVDIAQFWHHRLHGDPGHQWLRSEVFRNYFGMDSRGGAG